MMIHYAVNNEKKEVEKKTNNHELKDQFYLDKPNWWYSERW